MAPFFWVCAEFIIYPQEIIAPKKILLLSRKQAMRNSEIVIFLTASQLSAEPTEAGVKEEKSNTLFPHPQYLD